MKHTCSQGTIGELPIHIGDGNYSSKYPKSRDFLPSGVPFITASDLVGGRIRADNFRFISFQQHEELKKGHLKHGDVLVVTRGNGVGNVAFVDREYEGSNVNAQLVLLRADEKEFHGRFLYYLLSSPLYQGILKTFGTGSAQPQIPIWSLKRIELQYPRYSEQCAITRILGTLDDKIELNRRMNETLEAMVRAIFKSWFVDFDPVRAKAEGCDSGLPKHIADLFSDGFEDSELGEIPAGWEVRSLDKLANYLNGLALQKFPVTGDESLPAIKIAQLRAGHTEGADRVGANVPAQYVIEDGEVLFSWSGSLEIEIWCGGRGALNQHIFKVTSTKFPKWFYYLWTRHHLSDFQDTAADKATTMGHIQRRHLTEAKALVPPSNLLDAMDKHFGPIIDKIVANRIESRTLAAMRDTLLPKLISGELRVKATEVI